MERHQTRLCAVITEPTREGAQAAFRRAADEADLAEWRLDYLKDTDFADLDSIRAVLSGRPIPVIVTCRSVEEGGQQNVHTTTRIRLLAEMSKAGADYCDVEAAYYRQLAELNPDVGRLIVSYHNFSNTPSGLDNIYREITSLPAAVHKIITQTNQITDVIPIFELLDRSCRERRQLIAMAMGEAGLITRVLGPSRGSFLTYASLGRGRESAAGQVTCYEMSSMYRLHRITPDTQVMGVIGNPISHSASPAMHNAGFASQDLDAVYLPLKVEDLIGFFHRMVARSRDFDLRIKGLSVTIPHKTAVIPLLSELDETASAAGAVNCVTVLTDGSLRGSNTDVEGAMKPLEYICPLKDTDCAVIGAGGAARAVILGLMKRGASVTVFARDPVKAQPLHEALKVDVRPLPLFETSRASIVINTTPVGMLGPHQGESPVAAKALRGRTIAYDLVYNPVETRFLRDAREAGCKTISGIEMLAAQAALQFESWTGRRISAETLRDAGLEWLARR